MDIQESLDVLLRARGKATKTFRDAVAVLAWTSVVGSVVVSVLFVTLTFSNGLRVGDAMCVTLLAWVLYAIAARAVISTAHVILGRETRVPIGMFVSAVLIVGFVCVLTIDLTPFAVMALALAPLVLTVYSSRLSARVVSSSGMGGWPQWVNAVSWMTIGAAFMGAVAVGASVYHAGILGRRQALGVVSVAATFIATLSVICTNAGLMFKVTKRLARESEPAASPPALPSKHST